MAARQSDRMVSGRSGSAAIASEMARSSASSAWLRRPHSSRVGFFAPQACCPSSASQPQPIRPWRADPSVATVIGVLGRSRPEPGPAGR